MEIKHAIAELQAAIESGQRKLAELVELQWKEQEREEREREEQERSRVPDVVLAFLRELVLVAASARVSKHRRAGSVVPDGEQWLTVSELARLSLSDAFLAAYRGARVLMTGHANAIPELTAGRVSYLLTWICSHYSAEQPLACDDGALGTRTRHELPGVVVHRLHAGERLIRYRFESVSAPSAPRTNVVRIDSAELARVRERAEFMQK